MEGVTGEIKMFAGNFAPRSQAYCHGQLLPIAQNTALFSIIGTIYGGDGRTDFALPDLQGRTAVHAGRGPGLQTVALGQKGGAETSTIDTATMPSHMHAVAGYMIANDGAAAGGSPVDNFVPESGGNLYASGGTPNIPLAQGSVVVSKIDNNGSGQAHNNMQPYLVLNYIICLNGLYPSRS